MSVSPLFTADGQTWLESLRRLSVESVLLPVLLQLIVIILAARAFAWLFRKLGQPQVVGEIAAGLALGPSLLAWVWPAAFTAIFRPPLEDLDPAVADQLFRWILTSISQLGLVFLLLLVGLEFDFQHLRWRGKSALAISLSGVVTPFVLGLLLALVVYPFVEPHPAADEVPPKLGFALFMGTALSITAMPVLGRIMIELGITRTRIGTITIGAAAFDDATGWILLAAVAAIVRGQFEPMSILLMVVETAAFVLVMLLVARPLLRRWTAAAMRRGGGEIGAADLAVLLTLLLACAIVTSWIGIFAVFGAFLLGAALSENTEFRDAVGRKMGDFVIVFFLPIFFAYTGLRTDIGSLGSVTLWLLCGAVLLAAIIGKLGGCTLAARRTGFSSRESACIGTLMNTRGLMELIVVNVGYDMGVIPKSVYCMLVLMALVTTVMTTPLLLWLMKGTELEGPIRESAFMDAGNRPPGPE